jgi:hypothetical protein
MLGIRYDPEAVLRGLISEQGWSLAGPPMDQMSLFDEIEAKTNREDLMKCLTGQVNPIKASLVRA